MTVLQSSFKNISFKKLNLGNYLLNQTMCLSRTADPAHMGSRSLASQATDFHALFQLENLPLESKPVTFHMESIHARRELQESFKINWGKRGRKWLP